jgi:hypothetical protein
LPPRLLHHHVVVHELTSDEVCVVWADLLEKPFEVVHRWHCLTPAVACSGQGVPHVRAARLTIVAVGRGHDPLKALLAPLFATFDTLLGAMGGDVERHLPITARGHLLASLGKAEHDRLIAGEALGGDAAWLLERVPQEVTMSILLGALHAALRQQARATLVSLAASLRLAVLALPP